MMDADIKARWIARLRSGEETQAHGALERTDKEGNVSRCCLGVLTAMAVDEGVVIRNGTLSPLSGDDTLTTFGSKNANDGLSENAYLPNAVCEWSGVSYNGVYPYGNLDRSLAVWNDEGVPFDKIADIIEENF